jgi:hypothetical protein
LSHTHSHNPDFYIQQNLPFKMKGSEHTFGEIKTKKLFCQQIFTIKMLKEVLLDEEK